MRGLLQAGMLGLTVVSAFLLAQDPPNTSGTVPTVSFAVDFPGSDPDHYSFRVESDGQGVYESTAKVSPQSDEKDSFTLDFSLSPPTRTKIFELAQRANYFQGTLESKKRNIAASGTKTLAYKDAQRNASANYNYSMIPAVQELTTMFQSMSMTFEFGRRLQYDHRYQKLALDADLKRMEEMAKSNSLMEIGAIGPILGKISTDTSVINVVRARAQRLLAMAAESGTH